MHDSIKSDPNLVRSGVAGHHRTRWVGGGRDDEQLSRAAGDVPGPTSRRLAMADRAFAMAQAIHDASVR